MTVPSGSSPAGILATAAVTWAALGLGLLGAAIVFPEYALLPAVGVGFAVAKTEACIRAWRSQSRLEATRRMTGFPPQVKR